MAEPDVIKITDLRETATDLLLNIILHLSPSEFLALCSASKALWSLRLTPTYWRFLTRTTYRFPNQPLLQTDGARWKSLYQRLSTRTRPYTWGAHKDGALGHSWKTYEELQEMSSDEQLQYRSKSGVGWPTEMEALSQLGPVVDLQCGGWSTTLLTSKGDLHSCGPMTSGWHDTTHRPDRLRYPSNLPQGEQRIPMTTVAQYSQGRSCVLALADTGTMWSWTAADEPARRVRFLHLEYRDTTETAGLAVGESQPPEVKHVVAGWDYFSAYIARVGIVVWGRGASRARFPTRIPREISTPDDDVEDRTSESQTILNSSYQKPRGSAREPSAESLTLGQTVGEVINHVALEGFIVFLTHLGKVFAAKLNDLEQPPIELPGFEPSPGKSRMKEIQGSFRSFAAFNTDGDVILGHQDLLVECWRRFTDPTTSTIPSEQDDFRHRPQRPPGLQNQGIISLAFGDWHKLALTSQGHILAFDSEPQSCGCLGLGERIPDIRGPGYNLRTTFRGVIYNDGYRADGQLIPTAQKRGWRVWFSAEQREWLSYLQRGGCHTADMPSGPALIADATSHTRLSENVDAAGADWDLHPDVNPPRPGPDEDGPPQPAHLALSIAAAGWHSAALVLVDPDRIQRMYDLHRGFLPRPIPRPAATDDPSDPSSSTDSPGLLSRARDYVSGLTNPLAEGISRHLSGTSEDRSTAPSSRDNHGHGHGRPEIDQHAGREHLHYHSRLPFPEASEMAPSAARHEVRLAVLRGGEEGRSVS
ncbi:MAG: hypothetical protein M1817_005771 [Caeruleum heppii]|nr:MAG: hypothetical protein M1817_005771 [Caeruleum heppii]